MHHVLECVPERSAQRLSDKLPLYKIRYFSDEFFPLRLFYLLKRTKRSLFTVKK